MPGLSKHEPRGEATDVFSRFDRVQTGMLAGMSGPRHLRRLHLVTVIEEASGSAQTVGLADLAGSGLTLVETNITTASAARGKAVANLRLPPGDAVATVVRRGRTVRADPALRFRTGDRGLVVTSPDGEERIHDAFYPGTGAGTR